MAVREAVLKEVVDRVFPALNLEWETHGEEIRSEEHTSELQSQR